MPKPANEQMRAVPSDEITSQQGAERAEAERDGDEEHDLAEQLRGRDVADARVRVAVLVSGFAHGRRIPGSCALSAQGIRGI